MKADIRFEDGVVIELSQETTDRLRVELGRDDKQLVVDRFRAVKYDCGYLIALMNFECEIWDGEMRSDGGNAEATHYLMRSEIEKIIEGLTKMIKGEK